MSFKSGRSSLALLAIFCIESCFWKPALLKRIATIFTSMPDFLMPLISPTVHEKTPERLSCKGRVFKHVSWCERIEAGRGCCDVLVFCYSLSSVRFQNCAYQISEARQSSCEWKKKKIKESICDYRLNVEGAKLLLIDYWCDVPLEHIVAIGSWYSMLLLVHVALFSCVTHAPKIPEIQIQRRHAVKQHVRRLVFAHALYFFLFSLKI